MTREVFVERDPEVVLYWRGSPQVCWLQRPLASRDRHVFVDGLETVLYSGSATRHCFNLSRGIAFVVYVMSG